MSSSISPYSVLSPVTSLEHTATKQKRENELQGEAIRPSESANKKADITVCRVCQAVISLAEPRPSPSLDISRVSRQNLHTLPTILIGKINTFLTIKERYKSFWIHPMAMQARAETLKITQNDLENRSAKELNLTAIQVIQFAIRFPDIKSLNLTELEAPESEDMGFKGSDLTLLAKTCTKLGCLEFSCAYLKDPDLAPLATLTELKMLTLYDCEHLTDDGFAFLGTLTQLIGLELKPCTQITDKGFMHLASLKQLQSLFLIVCPLLTNTAFTHLTTQLTDLINLRLTAKVTDSEHLTELTGLGSTSKLKTLDLTGCCHIANNSLQVLASLTNLVSLNLDGCIQLDAIGFQHLAQIKTLKFLSLDSFAQLTDAELADFSNLKELECLILPKQMMITDTTLKILASLTKLEMLMILGGSTVSNDGFQQLSSLTELKTLCMQIPYTLSDNGLMVIRKFKHLQNVMLTKKNAHFSFLLYPEVEPLTSQGLKPFSFLKELKVIALENFESLLQFGGLTHIIANKRLDSLTLKNTPLTQVEFRQLIPLVQQDLLCLDIS